MICQDVLCPQECKVTGFNNFVTFDGETYNFDYAGELCHFTLTEVKVKITENQTAVIFAQIGLRKLLKKQSDQGLHWLPFRPHLFESSYYQYG